ncbi:hypothetical protein ABZY57_20545, partial [Streptomyces sp. NPDC006450]|uniref:hypothetical protein n=1 Tax=Streptomyces sp. NPDC006450 TaxID=3155458 RepID=UPI0033A758B3
MKKMLLIVPVAATVLLGGGGWYVWDSSAPEYVESLCDAPYGTDTEVATSAQGIAVVEATGPAGPVSLEGISDAEARKFVTTPVRVLEAMKETWRSAVRASTGARVCAPATRTGADRTRDFGVRSA